MAKYNSKRNLLTSQIAILQILLVKLHAFFILPRIITIHIYIIFYRIIFHSFGCTMETVDERREAEAAIAARDYQIEIFEEACKRNVIVCLGTGTGKTFISVMLIKQLAHEIRGELQDGGQRTFFLVTTGITFFCFTINDISSSIFFVAIFKNCFVVSIQHHLPGNFQQYFVTMQYCRVAPYRNKRETKDGT